MTILVDGKKGIYSVCVWSCREDSKDEVEKYVSRGNARQRGARSSDSLIKELKGLLQRNAKTTIMIRKMETAMA